MDGHVLGAKRVFGGLGHLPVPVKAVAMLLLGLLGLSAIAVILLLLATAASYLGIIGKQDLRCSFYSGFATGDAYGSAWSPTGAQIALARADGFPPEIFVVKVTSVRRGPPQVAEVDEPRRLPNVNCASAFPSWSPDGRRIAYAGNYEPHARYDIWVMDADGSHSRLVARGHGSGTGGNKDNPGNWWEAPLPSWSPDGQSLAFATLDAAGVSAVWIVRANGTHLRRVTPPSLPALDPSWSPDGRSIAFATALTGRRAGIWLMDSDGSDAHQLTNGADFSPVWSPKGESVAFARDTSDTIATLWVAPAKGGQAKQLTTDDAYLPAWSPDGRWIAFSSDRDGNARLYVTDASGRVERPLFSEQAETTRSSSVEQLQREVAAAANRSTGRPVNKVTCVTTTSVSTCAVTFSGPACQIWIAVEKSGRIEAIPPPGKPIEGAVGFLKANGVRCARSQ